MKPLAVVACLSAFALAGAHAQSIASATTAIRDPFHTPVANREDALGPLQRIALEQLKLAAVMSGSLSRALLQDDAGNGYIVAIGALVGARAGVVASIEPGRVVIEEADDRGRARHIVLDLFAAAPTEEQRGPRP